MAISDYNIRVPVDVTGQQQLEQLRTAIRGNEDAFRGLTKQMQEFVRQVRDEVNASGNLTTALNDIRRGATGASEAFRQTAGQLQAYNIQVREAEAQTKRFQQAFAAIGGRLGGMASGIPGGGFIGSSAIRSLGLSGGAAMAVGAGALGIFAAIDLTKQISDLGKWAQEQKNAAAAVGVTNQQMQVLSRLSETTGVNMQSAAKAVASLGDELWKGGSRAREIQTALGQLGLPTSTAFENPAKGLQEIATALSSIGSQSERLTVAKQLLGEIGTEVAAQADAISKMQAKNIFDDKTLDNLTEAHKQLQQFSDAWDMLIAKAAKPLTFVINTVVNSGSAQKRIDSEHPPVADPFAYWDTHPSGIMGPPAPTDEQKAQMAADRTKWYGQLQQTIGPDQFANTDKRLDQDKSDLDADVKLGKVSQAQAAARLRSIEAQRKANADARRQYQERQRQQDELVKEFQTPVLDWKDAGHRLEGLDKKYDLVGGFTDEQGNGLTAYRSFLQGQLMTGLGAYNQPHLQSESDKLTAEFRKQQTDRENKARESQQKLANETYDYAIGGIKQKSDSSTAQARQLGAILSGRTSLLGSAGLNGPALAQRELQDTLATLQATSSAKGDELQASLLALQGKSTLLPVGSQEQQAQIAEQMRQKQGELDQLDIDTKTKSIEALNKFNDAIEKTRKQIEDEFGSGFASIIMGAQNKGGQGALTAFRGFFEQQESAVLKNIGGLVFQNSGITGVSQNSPWAGILKGTIFGPQGQQLLISSTDTNTEATKANTAAITDMTVRFGDGTSSSSSSASLDALNNLPVLGSGASLTNLLSSGGSASTSQVVAASLGSVGSVMTGLSKALSGAQYVGNIGAVTSGIVYNPAGGPVSAPQGSNGPYDVTFNSGGYTTLSTGQVVGAAAADIGAAVGAAIGVQTIAKGGAKNVSGGLAETLGAIAPFTGPAAPFVAGAAAVAGLVSAFLPDPRTARANQISKTLFTQQYLAPQAVNISEDGSGGYADVNQYGNVRSSNFSPYPIVSNAYLDVPRRTVVPGHTISSFGGYLNETGAKNPQIPTYNITIHAMDSKSILDSAGPITDAVHLGIQKGHPALISTMRQQLGN